MMKDKININVKKGDLFNDIKNITLSHYYLINNFYLNKTQIKLLTNFVQINSKQLIYSIRLNLL